MIKMESPVTQIARVRRALSPDFAMSNNSTPATDQMKKSTSVSEEEWKTPRKEGYPDQSPRSSARKWLKSEEALLTHFGKIPKRIGKNLAKFSKFLTSFAKFCLKKQQNFQQFLTKILRLENGAKECIV